MNSQNSSVPESARTDVRLADAKKKPTVPEEIRVLLGPSWIVEGEDAQLLKIYLRQLVRP